MRFNGRSLARACSSSPAVLVAQAAAIVPNENLVADGLPADPGEHRGRRRAVHGVPERGALGVAPDARGDADRHALRGRRRRRTRWPFAGGARRQLTFFGDRVLSARPTSRPMDAICVIEKDIGGNEFSQLYRFDLASGQSTLLTDGKSRNNFGAWSRSGARVAYTLHAAQRDGRRHLRRSTRPTRRATGWCSQVDGGGWAPLDWSPDGKWLLVLQDISVNESYLWLVSVATGEKTLLTPKGKEPVSYQGGVFSQRWEGRSTP